MNKAKTLIVIGGGAAGFFCAVNAARLAPGLKVIILEKSAKVLAKVRISGGGRCNVTHDCFNREQLIQFYPRGKNFLKKAFYQFYTRDTVNWFTERGVPLKTEEDGRIFPESNDSLSIIACLLQEVDKYGVELLLNRDVTAVQPLPTGWGLTLRSGEYLEANYLVVASGGYPKAEQFAWLLETGHSIENPVPSLFTFNLLDNTISTLTGISVPEVKVKILDSKLEELGPLLITHWGFSGPAILRLSAKAARLLNEKNYQFSIRVNWVPSFTEQSLIDTFKRLRQDQAKQKIGGRNPFALASRLWIWFLEQEGINIEENWAALKAGDANKLAQRLTGSVYTVNAKTTFKEEFVTAGGIKTNEINPLTMESKLAPGLFFAGEIMDVDGITGGFNFQHAWTSGFLAAQKIAQEENLKK